MINIYAETFMLATLTDRPWLRDAPSVPREKRLRPRPRRYSVLTDPAQG